MHERTRANLLHLMSHLGIPSARALALECHMSQSTLSRFLAGKTVALSVAHLRTLARVLGVTVSQLTGESPLIEDPRVSKVAAAMAKMPEDKKDMMVALSKALSAPCGEHMGA